MCGISGVVYFNDIAISHDIISSFNNQLKHRGPDGSDVWIDRELNLGLGHRRLSILDLSDNASQPMSFANERYWMVFNGEIFNFIELKEKLILLGHSFRTESDSEVILAAYAEWRDDCVKHFNGMWAIVILDRETKTLFISRDRFGIKPLYYVLDQNFFAFASESIAFNKLYGFKKELNSNNILYTITDVYALEGTGETIYKNLYQIRSGHNATLNLLTKKFKQYQWWNTLENKVDIPEKYKDQVVVFKELLEDATKIRMRSDVPVASALSGGLDSSAVYCMINKIMKNGGASRVPSNWQKAYNIGFPGSIFDESHFAKQVIDYTGGEGRFLIPDYSNLVDDIVSSTLLFDNIYNIPIYPLTTVYGGMNMDGYKISMDGHGVDEMMFGYRSSIRSVYFNAIKRGDEKQVYAIKETYLDMFPVEDQINERQKLLNLTNARNQGNKANLLVRGLRKIGRLLHTDTKAKSLYSYLGEYTPVTNPNTINHLDLELDNQHLYSLFHQSVLPSILRNFDRGAMQKSIEIRMPFMDWRIVSFVFSLPVESKLGGGFTKRILRDTMSGIMPDSIRERKLKVGMSSPLSQWFGNELKTLILDELHSTSFKSNELWDAKGIIEFVEDNMKQDSWTYEKCIQLWPIFNAHLLMKNIR